MGYSPWGCKRVRHGLRVRHDLATKQQYSIIYIELYSTHIIYIYKETTVSLPFVYMLTIVNNLINIINVY